MAQKKHPRQQARHARRRIGVFLAIIAILGVSGAAFWLTRIQTPQPTQNNSASSSIKSDQDLDTLLQRLDAVQITGGEGSTTELDAQARFSN